MPNTEPNPRPATAAEAALAQRRILSTIDHVLLAEHCTRLLR